MLYGCDGAWWKLNKGVPGFQGRKLTNDAGVCVSYPDIHKVQVVEKCDQLLVEEPGRIGSGSRHGGGNSGFQAYNLAVQFGARRIILVGFDMRVDLGVHWHGRHPRGLNNPSDPLMVAWRMAMNHAANTARSLGVEVMNASPVSALTAYPVLEINQCLS